MPRTQRTRGRKAAIVVVAVVAGLLVGLFVLRGVFGFIGAAYMQGVSIDVSATTHNVVGGTSSFSVTVTNPGRDIKNFVIITNIEGRDNWLQHHVVTDSGGCTVDRSQRQLLDAGGSSRFLCGPIANGSTETFTIRGSPTDAGNFSYMLHYEDERGGGWMAVVAGANIASSSRQYEWSEAVLP